MEEKKLFFKKYGYLFSLGCLLTSFLFLFGCAIKLETKYYVGEEKIKEYFNLNLINLLDVSLTKIMTMVLIIVLIGAAMIFIVVAGLTKNRIAAQKSDAFVTTSIFLSLIAICFIFMSKEIFVYFASNENSLIPNFNGASLGWGASVSIVFLALSILFDISFSSYSEQNSVKIISEDGLLIAMAFVLNFVKLPISATGGSVNFQMLPLMIIALRRGPLHGFVCGGIIYGLLTCMTDGYGFATYPFDYLIGFGSVGVIGFFKNYILNDSQKTYNVKGELFILLGGVLSTLVRYFGSCVSSMVIYDLDFVSALVYNAVYIPVSGAISVALIMAMYGPLLYINRRFPASKIMSNN